MTEPINDPAGAEGGASAPSVEPTPEETFPEEPTGCAAPLEAVFAEGLKAIRAELAAKLTYDRFKEEQIERLHKELQAYKGDLLRRATEPLFHGLIKLHDHLGQLLESLAQQPPEELSPPRLLGHLDEFRDDVELLLGRHGVEPFSIPEEAFDPRRQTAVERRLVEDSSLAGRIAGRVRPGFELGEVVLQKERVAVFVDNSAGQPKTPSPQEPTPQEDESP